MALGHLAAAGAAAACPVCYGAAEGSVIQGTQMSVAFLGGLVYVVFAGAAGMVVLLRRRVRRGADPHHGLTLVPPPVAAGDDPGGEATP